MEQWINTKQASELCKIKERTIQKWCREKRDGLKIQRFGSRWMIWEPSLFLNQEEKSPTPPTESPEIVDLKKRKEVANLRAETANAERGALEAERLLAEEQGLRDLPEILKAERKKLEEREQSLNDQASKIQNKSDALEAQAGQIKNTKAQAFGIINDARTKADNIIKEANGYRQKALDFKKKYEVLLAKQQEDSGSSDIQDLLSQLQ